jgi:hypothetical protein
MKRKYLNFAGILLAGTLLFASPVYAATVEYDNLRQNCLTSAIICA